MNDASTCEQAEMQTIQSLTSGMTCRQAATACVHENRSHIELNGEVEWELGKISDTFNPRAFANRLIAEVNIASTHREDMDKLEEERKISVVSDIQHLDVRPTYP